MSGKGAKGLAGKGAKGTMGGKGKGDKKKAVSRSVRAGLQFPVGRIHRMLKVREKGRVRKRDERWKRGRGGWNDDRWNCCTERKT